MAERYEIPQATLARTRAVLDALARGSTTREQIELATGISQRQTGYGVAAARAFGLAVEHGDELALTERGRAIARTPVGSLEEQRTLRETLAQCELVLSVAPGLFDGEPPTRAQIAARIAELSELSPGTAVHRAGMILGWRRELARPPDAARRKLREVGGRWRRIEICGLRSLAAAELEVAPFTVVLGPIGSGKSALVRALALGGELARHAEGLAALGDGPSLVRADHGGPLVVDHRAAATRGALGESYQRHRFGLAPDGAGGLAFAEELFEVRHHGERLARLERGDEASGAARAPHLSIGPVARRDPAFGRLAPLLNATLLDVEPRSIRARGGGDGPRLASTGANLPAALAAAARSRAYGGLLEAMRNIVPGLQALEVTHTGEHATGLSLRRTMAPGVVGALALAELSDGVLAALAVLTASVLVGPDELLVVEHPDRYLDEGALPLVLEALRAASRRATVVLTTHHERVAEQCAPDALVRASLSSGRTELSAPGLRVVL